MKSKNKPRHQNRTHLQKKKSRKSHRAQTEQEEQIIQKKLSVQQALLRVANGSPLQSQSKDVLTLQRTIGNKVVRKLLANSVTPSRRSLRNGKIGGRINNLGASKNVIAGSHQITRILVSALPGTGDQVVHRYESHEHARFGDVESLIGPEEKKYKVKAVVYVVPKNKRPKDIAAKYGVSPDFLFARNPDLVKTWRTSKKRKVRGFKAGETIIIPGPTVSQVAKKFGLSEKEVLSRNAGNIKIWTDPIGNKSFQGFDRGVQIIIPTGKSEVKGRAAAASAPTGKPPEKTVTINKVRFKYGEVIALGDFYAKPSDMYSAKRSELKELRRLIRKEAKDPSSVGTEDWQKATNKRYLKLAEANVTHFAPSNKALTPAGAGFRKNHKTEWEKHHHKALKAAKAGDKNKALGTNAFADHFLTDAFAAGHLIDKKDVTRDFEIAFTPEVQKKFFEKVAELAWKEKKVSRLLSKYETYEAHTAGWNPNINSADRFAKLLQGVYEDPTGRETILNTVPKIVHDSLNETGVEVTNKKGDRWRGRLTGDGRLNTETLAIGRKAVAQSQVNVLNNIGMTETPDYLALFEKVWAYVPYPTKKGEKRIREVLSRLTDPEHKDTLRKAADIIKEQAPTIVEELVNRKKLKKA